MDADVVPDQQERNPILIALDCHKIRDLINCCTVGSVARRKTLPDMHPKHCTTNTRRSVRSLDKSSCHLFQYLCTAPCPVSCLNLTFTKGYLSLSHTHTHTHTHTGTHTHTHTHARTHARTHAHTHTHTHTHYDTGSGGHTHTHTHTYTHTHTHTL